MSKITIKKAEKELLELKDAFKLASARINENGGSKSQLWLFEIKHKIWNLEDKIKDMKANKVRTDELLPEDLAIEKRIKKLESSLEEIGGGK